MLTTARPLLSVLLPCMKSQHARLAGGKPSCALASKSAEIAGKIFTAFLLSISNAPTSNNAVYKYSMSIRGSFASGLVRIFRNMLVCQIFGSGGV